jgi:hypothetical protein
VSYQNTIYQINEIFVLKKRNIKIRKKLIRIHYSLWIDLEKFKLPRYVSSFRKTKDYDSILRHHLMKIFFNDEKKSERRKKKVKSPTKNTHRFVLMRN